MFGLLMLAVESHNVIARRIMKMMSGDPDAFNEAYLIVYEKIDAAAEASISLMTGLSANAVIDSYRQHVSANAERLR